jgi:menaquinone-dependent protoporphyrinogen oxidase
MSTNLLITYGSWADGTKNTAIVITETLKQIPGLTVDVQPAKIVKDLSPYQAVIIGSGARMAALHPSVINFIIRHEKALKTIPSAFFISCLTMKVDTQDNRETTKSYMDGIKQRVKQYQPVSLGLFGGVIDYSKLPFYMRFFFQKSDELAEGDFRDWDKINQWAKDVTRQMLPQLPQ